jgi:hypothetical protein
MEVPSQPPRRKRPQEIMGMIAGSHIKVGRIVEIGLLDTKSGRCAREYQKPDGRQWSISGIVTVANCEGGN